MFKRIITLMLLMVLFIIPASVLSQNVEVSEIINPVDNGEHDFDNFVYNTTPANVNPSISISNTTLVYTENDAPTQIDATATASDADGDADWNGGKLEVQISANAESADEISIPDNLINTSGMNIFDADTVIGTLSHSEGTITNSTKLTITFNSSSTNARVQKVIRAIYYRNTSDNPGTSDRTVTFTVTDNNSASANDTRTIAVIAVNVPTVTTTAASSISTTSATFGGEVISDGGAAVFERGVVYSTSDSTPTIGEGGVTKDTNGTGAGTFSKSIGSLNVNTTYYYDAYAINSEGTSYGGVRSFTTIKATPTVTAWPTATGITYGDDLSSATLIGGTASVSGSFAYDNNTIIPNVGIYSADLTFTPTDATNYNTVGGNIDINVYNIATVTTNAASGIAARTVTVNGIVNANNASTGVTFEYGLTTSYGTTIAAAQSPVTGITNTDVNADISELTPNTIYHYRVVGVNVVGTSNGADLTFTTLSPTVEFNSTSSNGLESVSSADLQVGLSAVSGTAITVEYVIVGTATGMGTDYTLADGTLTISAGDANDNITIIGIVNDLFDEDNESVILTLSNPTNATLGTNTVHTYTIIDDDASPTISDVTDNSTDEDTPTSAIALTTNDADGDSMFLAGISSNQTLLPDSNIVFGGSGDNRTIALTPSLNEFGTVTVILTVDDGNTNSSQDTFILTVNPINDAPVITGQMVLSVEEEKPLEILVDSLTIVDPDNDIFTLSVLDSADYTRSGNTITSDVGFLGDLSVYVQVDDGETKELSEIFILTVTVVEDTGIESSIPHTTALYQNYPNPFNPTTTIEYEIINDCKVEIMIYNNSGMLIKDLVNEHKTTGKYSVIFDAVNLPSGMYYYQMKADGCQKFNKSILIK